MEKKIESENNAMDPEDLSSKQNEESIENLLTFFNWSRNRFLSYKSSYFWCYATVAMTPTQRWTKPQVYYLL